jgi:frataxin-like iron-binding protein CyaY
MVLPRLFVSRAEAFPVTVRAINRYKAKYPILFNDYQTSKKSGDLTTYQAITLSEEGQTEYLSLVENDLVLTRLPNSNRQVWITTHNGGKHVGFYENGKWYYQSGSGNIIEEQAIVIRWTEAKKSSQGVF